MNTFCVQGNQKRDKDPLVIGNSFSILLVTASAIESLSLMPVLTIAQQQLSDLGH